MRPKRWPYNGHKKRSCYLTSRAFEQAYLDFVSKNQRKKQVIAQELKTVISRVSELEKQINSFFMSEFGRGYIAGMQAAIEDIIEEILVDTPEDTGD